MLSGPRTPFGGSSFLWALGWGGPGGSPPKVEGRVLKVPAAAHGQSRKGEGLPMAVTLFPFQKEGLMPSHWQAEGADS